MAATTSALFLHGWHPYTFNSIVPGWPIAVETTFYLVFPILLGLIITLRRAALGLLIGIFFTIIEAKYIYNWLMTRVWPDVHDVSVMNSSGRCGFLINSSSS